MLIVVDSSLEVELVHAKTSSKFPEEYGLYASDENTCWSMVFNSAFNV